MQLKHRYEKSLTIDHNRVKIVIAIILYIKPPLLDVTSPDFLFILVGCHQNILSTEGHSYCLLDHSFVLCVTSTVSVQRRDNGTYTVFK